MWPYALHVYVRRLPFHLERDTQISLAHRMSLVAKGVPVFSFTLCLSLTHVSFGCFPSPWYRSGRVCDRCLSATEEDAREDFEYDAAEDDESEEAYA